MSTTLLNGLADRAGRTPTPKYYADHPDAVPADQTTVRLRWPQGSVSHYVVQSFRKAGEDYVRVAGELFRTFAGLAGAAPLVTVQGVPTKDLFPRPIDRVHAYQCVPLSALRAANCVTLGRDQAAELDAALANVKRIADRNAAARQRLAVAAPDQAQAPAPPPAPTDLKAAVAARLAEQRRAADAAAADGSHVRMKLAVAEAELHKLGQSVLEAFMMDTDAERLAALAVIAERLTA